MHRLRDTPHLAPRGCPAPPTSARFLFYELVQAEVVRRGVRGNAAARYASIDRWDGKPAPLILVRVVVAGRAVRHRQPLHLPDRVNQTGSVVGFLVSKVASMVRVKRRNWERVALTEQQVRENDPAE